MDSILQSFYKNSQSFLINFSIETKLVVEQIKSPVSLTRSSPRSKLTPPAKLPTPHLNGKKNGVVISDDDDDIIEISPPTTPITKNKSSLNNSFTSRLNRSASQLLNETTNSNGSTSNLMNTSNGNGSNDKRLTRSAKTSEPAANSIELIKPKTSHYKLNGHRKHQIQQQPIQQPIQIFYQFIKNDTNKLDLTNAKNSKSSKTPNHVTSKLLTYKLDVVCPFCQLDCKRVNFLCFHFQMCHFRFNIEEQTVNNNSATNGAAVNSSNHISQALMSNNYMACYSDEYSGKKIVHFNIRLDENFNGSYLGNPYDIHYSAHLGFSLSRIKPSKRNLITFILVNK